ncbi:hypothetical protein ACET3Z_021574 [Daucus carota]
MKEAPLPLLISKGKDALYEEYAFYKDGIISDEAIGILESGYLGKYSKVFCNHSLDLESPVSDGFLAKDILHYACLETLEIVAPLLQTDPLPVSDFDLLPVHDMLVAMDFDPPKVKMVDGEAADVGGTSKRLKGKDKA